MCRCLRGAALASQCLPVSCQPDQRSNCCQTVFILRGASCQPDHVFILRGASCQPDHVFTRRGASYQPDHVFILRGASCQPDQRSNYCQTVFILRDASGLPDHVFILRGASGFESRISVQIVAGTVFILGGASCQPDQR